MMLGAFLLIALSCLSLRQPLTTSKPSSNFASSSGISSGSFCKSPSIGMMMSPFAKSNPAIIAAVCPKLRRKCTTFTRSSFAAIPSSNSSEPSVLPSFTRINSHVRPIFSIAPRTFS